MRVLIGSSSMPSIVPRSDERSAAAIDRNLQRLLKEAVDDGLLTLGVSARNLIYYLLEKKHGLKPDQIPDRLQAFQDALRGLFGRGTTPLERHIAKRLYSKLNLSFKEHEDWTLVDYVNHAKQEASTRNP